MGCGLWAVCARWETAVRFWSPPFFLTACLLSVPQSTYGLRIFGTMHKSSYRESQTPSQQLYSKLCGKSKTRPDPVVSEGLAARALRGNVEKYTPADVSVMGMLCRRLKGFTHIAVRSGSLEALEARSRKSGHGHGSARSRARQRSGGSQPGPGEDEMQVLCSGIAKSLSICPRLHTIELPGLQLGHGALKHLGRGLCATASLKRLDLRHCGIGDDGLTILVKSLVNCKSVNDLCLASNRLRDTSAPRISSVIRRHGARRDDGFWASCLRDGTMSAASSRGLEPSDAEMAVQLRGITALDLSSNNFSDDGVCHIATTLESDGWLVALNLRNNRVSEVGAQSIKAALHINESLSVIDFRPREEPPKFDDMGHIIKSPKRSLARAESMTWAMRRRPRKGISADHPEVQQVLARWGLLSASKSAAAGSSQKTPRSQSSSSGTKGSTKKKRSSTNKKTAGRKTRMAISKAKISGTKSKSPSRSIGKIGTSGRGKTNGGGSKSTKDDAPPAAPAAPSTRTFRAPKKTTKKLKKRGAKKKTARSLSGGKDRRKNTTVSSRTKKTKTESVSSSPMQRPQSAHDSRRSRSNVVAGRQVLERPKTARGGNRLRQRKGNLSNGTHPGIVGLGEVEPPRVQGGLSEEAKDLIDAVYERVSGGSEEAVPVREIIIALRKNPSAPAILQFRDRSNPPADLLEQGKIINRPALHAFFEQHARAVQAVSPTGKSTNGQRWASPRTKGSELAAVTVSEGVTEAATEGGDGSAPGMSQSSPGGVDDVGSDPAVLEVLEGWVDQLHGYIDNIEQGIEIPENALGSGIIVDAHRK